MVNIDITAKEANRLSHLVRNEKKELEIERQISKERIEIFKNIQAAAEQGNFTTGIIDNITKKYTCLHPENIKYLKDLGYKIQVVGPYDEQNLIIWRDI